MPAHLRPCAPIAADAIVCGDPSRALAIAQAVLPAPRMSNHHRGLWGYYGETGTGAAGELTIQSTGIGGPSAVTVLSELADLGVRRVIRVGTCGAAASGSALGTRLIVAGAVSRDGASAALGADPGETLAPDAELTAALADATGAPATDLVSQDLQPAAWFDGRGADAPGDERPSDLQTAATFAFASSRGLAAAAVVVVTSAGDRRLEDEPVEAALLDLAAGAARAFLLHEPQVEG